MHLYHILYIWLFMWYPCSTQPQQQPHSGLHQTQAPPGTFSPSSSNPSHIWILRKWQVMPGCEARSLWDRETFHQTFLPFLWSHFYNYMQGGTSADARPKLTRLKKTPTTTKPNTPPLPTPKPTTKKCAKTLEDSKPNILKYYTNYPEKMVSVLTPWQLYPDG